MPKDRFQHKIFVRERNETAEDETRNILVYPRPSELSGSEAKQIYEEIISTEPSPLPKSFNTKRNYKSNRPSKTNSQTVQPAEKEIFKLAQRNNLKELKILINSGVNLNLKDEFGWTALMCAACGGAKEAVELLLLAGADKSIKDRSGYNAKSLARKEHHEDIVTLLSVKYEPKSKVSQKSTQNIEYFCKLCGAMFQTSKRKHEASTVHLLREQSKKTKTFYGIPEGNKGFQLLMRHGWDREQGLGPDGSGRKFPIKAKQKVDRRGIGAVPAEKKECDRSAPPRISEVVSSSKREKRLERNFRREFY